MNRLDHTDKDVLKRLAIFALLFFFWGFITVLNFAISEHLKQLFSIDYAVGTLIDITFFSSYLVFSSISGSLIERVGYKRSIITGWMLLCLGCFLIYFAIDHRQYYLFLSALFIQAAGITTLQVGANLYVVLMGDKRSAASRLTLLQALNSLGTLLGPVFALSVIRYFSNLPEEIRKNLPVQQLIEIDSANLQLPYLYIGVFMLLFAFVMSIFHIPDIPTSHLEPLNKITSLRKRHVLHFPQLRLGAFAIFAYVGAEVALAKYIETFTDDLSKYYWGCAMIGRFVGAYLLLRYSPRVLVTWAAAVAGVLVFLSIITYGAFSIYCVVAVGLFNSVLFPCIFSLGVNGLGKFSLDGSAILIMFIVGGAVIPFNVLNYSFISYKIAFIIPLCCYVYILVYGKKLSYFEVQEPIVKQGSM
ncbi:MAG: sugar MFS transporter [Cytophagaceae bacterium]|jgi:FHS family L-fucose permease-like MFS transporter|nr:sugar MFS transporter [Cytophagaceae bacterium]